MKEYDLLTTLLDLRNLRVTRYQLVGQLGINLFIESTIEAAVCPHCQELSQKVHELSPEQKLRDLSMWNRRCHLHYRPRRFVCESCESTFVERVVWRESGYTYTKRYEQYIFEKTRRQPIAQVAKDERLSEAIVQGIFTRHAQKK